MCRRGDIYTIDFDCHAETKKQTGLRPVVIVSNNKANNHSPVITVVPLTTTTWKRRFLPTHVYIMSTASNGPDFPSIALAEQVEAIGKNRLIEKKGNIGNKSLMSRITKAIQVQIGVLDEYNQI